VRVCRRTPTQPEAVTHHTGWNAYCVTTLWYQLPSKQSLVATAATMLDGALSYVRL
jgi:hypothetical protein